MFAAGYRSEPRTRAAGQGCFAGKGVPTHRCARRDKSFGAVCRDVPGAGSGRSSAAAQRAGGLPPRSSVMQPMPSASRRTPKPLSRRGSEASAGRTRWPSMPLYWHKTTAICTPSNRAVATRLPSFTADATSTAYARSEQRPAEPHGEQHGHGCSCSNGSPRLF